MNELNYASLEASKRLVEAGITLETDFYWCDNLGWVTLRPKEDVPIESCDWKIYPAPSMAEGWRELPGDIYIEKKRYRLSCWKIGKNDLFGCTYVAQDSRFLREPLNDENPTDALIDLLIWVRRNHEHNGQHRRKV